MAMADDIEDRIYDPATTWFRGEEIQYTGTQPITLHGGTFWEAIYLTGPNKGQKLVTAKSPN